MRQYPKIITKTVIEQYQDIDNNTILRNIADTKSEICKMERCLDAERILAEGQEGTTQGRIAAFIHDAHAAGIADRLNFVRFLYALLHARENKILQETIPRP